MRKTIIKIWNFVTWILILFLAAGAVLLTGVRLIGLRPLAVLSGSMEPEFSAGDLIYVRSVDHRELKEGDIISFLLSEDVIATHRIVGIVPDENDPSVIRYRTKGDANDFEDGTMVHYKNVVGTPVYSLPGMGRVASYIQTPPGSYIAIFCVVDIMLLICLPAPLRSGRSGTKGKKSRKRGRKKGKYER